MDERRFVVWDADGRPLATFLDFDMAHRWAHMRLRLPTRLRAPLTVDDRVAKISRQISPGRCELVAWAEFAVLPGCDLPGGASGDDDGPPVASAVGAMHPRMNPTSTGQGPSACVPGASVGAP
jgi:hypothetical protein